MDDGYEGSHVSMIAHLPDPRALELDNVGILAQAHDLDLSLKLFPV